MVRLGRLPKEDGRYAAAMSKLRSGISGLSKLWLARAEKSALRQINAGSLGDVCGADVHTRPRGGRLSLPASMHPRLSKSLPARYEGEERPAPPNLAAGRPRSCASRHQWATSAHREDPVIHHAGRPLGIRIQVISPADLPAIWADGEARFCRRCRHPGRQEHDAIENAQPKPRER